jgi:hypothetical protein
VPAGNRNKCDRLRVVTNLFDKVRSLLYDFVETILRPLGGVHFVDGDNKLSHSESEGKKGMFTSLTVLGDTSFEFTSTTSNDQNSAIGLRSTCNHVLDEVTVTRSIDDLLDH